METINKLKHLIYAVVILIGILAYWQVNRYNRYQYVVRGSAQYAIDKKTHLVYRLVRSQGGNALGTWGRYPPPKISPPKKSKNSDPTDFSEFYKEFYKDVGKNEEGTWIWSLITTEKF